MVRNKQEDSTDDDLEAMISSFGLQEGLKKDLPELI